MKIAVCVKYVPDAAAERSFADDHTTDRVGSTGILSELDEYAVEEALKIREAGEAEVIVLTMGPEGAETALKKGLQMGADRAVHVSDPGLHGADAPATSLVLANAIKRLEVDLVLCGMASTDGVMGVVPAMIAERLDLAQVTLAGELSVDGGTARIRRDGEDAVEEVEAALPAVVSVTDQINEPRYPSFKGIMAAKKKEIVTWTLADLDVAPDQVGLPASWTAVTEVTKRPPRTKGTVVTDDGTGATQLADFLASSRFV